jgi:hypothetical protein
LILLTPSPETEEMNARKLINAYQNLPALERMTVREAIMDTQAVPADGRQEALMRMDTVEIKGEVVDAPKAGEY